MKDRLSGAPKIVTCASPISRPLTLFTALRGAGGKRSPVSNLPAHDIGRLALQGGTAKFAGQALNFLLRLLYIVTVARLLTPADFGLVTMVVAITGIYELFATGGLSTAAIQTVAITEEQISTLFWINVLIGIGLTLLCMMTAPLLVSFYHEPRLFWVTIALSPSFLFSALGAQHSAILQRQLRYIALTTIETLATLCGIVTAIILAVKGFGYWALVASAVISPAVTTASMWAAVGWVPGRPRSNTSIQSMLHFGGTITLNSLVSYATYNLDKLLLGRFWGADKLGIYGRANQIIMLPTTQIHGAMLGIALSVLSRLQNDPARFRRFFLSAYSLVISVTAPMTIFSACFAEDIVLVVLGPQWWEAAPVFRFLAPTVLIFGIINPTSWLVLALGLQKRSLAIALVIAPLCVTAYFIGLPWGPSGVALCYSTAMTLWLFPHIIWAVRGTPISPSDYFHATWPPIISALIAGMAALLVRHYLSAALLPLWSLVLEGCAMTLVHVTTLLFVMGQKDLYTKIFSILKPNAGESRVVDA